MTATATDGGFLNGLWFGIRNFIGAAVIALGAGAALALVCLVIGLILGAIFHGLAAVLSLSAF